VRAPVGREHAHECLGALPSVEKGRAYTTHDLIGYVEARKQIYFALYERLVREQPLFLELRERHRRGENLLIAEVDGPARRASTTIAVATASRPTSSRQTRCSPPGRTWA
jgi:hypothetical protein